MFRKYRLILLSKIEHVLSWTIISADKKSANSHVTRQILWDDKIVRQNRPMLPIVWHRLQAIAAAAVVVVAAAVAALVIKGCCCVMQVCSSSQFRSSNALSRHNVSSPGSHGSVVLYYVR